MLYCPVEYARRVQSLAIELAAAVVIFSAVDYAVDHRTSRTVWSRPSNTLILGATLDSDPCDEAPWLNSGVSLSIGLT